MDHVLSIGSYKEGPTPCISSVIVLLIATTFRTSTRPIPQASCATKWLFKVIAVNDLTIRMGTLLVGTLVTSLVNVWKQPSKA